MLPMSPTDASMTLTAARASGKPLDIGYDDIAAAILTLATVTHHQNGMKP